MKYTARILPGFLVLATSLGCGSKLKLNSDYRQSEIKVDGNQSDWRGSLTFIEDKNTSIGVSNDQDFLYIAFASGDPVQQRQFMMRGLIVWFDAEGGDKKTVGIRFPIGLMADGPPMMMGGRGEDFDPEIMREAFEQSLTELEIIGPEKDKTQRYRVGELAGVEVKTGDPQNNFFYEIKVPLDKGQLYPFSVALEPGETLGLGFETPEFDREAMRERMGRGGMGGGMGGGRGGRRGGRGGFGGGRGNRAQMFESFKLWVTVELSTEDKMTSTGAIRIMPAESEMSPASDLPRVQPQHGQSDGAPAVGEMAPTFILKSLDGNSETDLQSFRGQKPVVLFFGSYT